jgi:transposase
MRRIRVVFAALAGASPIPVTSGQTQGRVRLNRGGDPDANSALRRIAIVRMATDHHTRDYITKRQSEGKTKTEAIRCLKRYITREVHNALPFQALA